MPTVIRHRKVNIVVLESGEQIDACCKPGDIALQEAEGGWWASFIGTGGQVDSYDAPYPSYNEALWAAKAAAEFGMPG